MRLVGHWGAPWWVTGFIYVDPVDTLGYALWVCLWIARSVDVRVAWFIVVHPAGHPVGSLVYALRIVRFLRSGSLRSLECTLGVVCGAPWGSFEITGSIKVHHGIHRARLWSLGSLGCTLGLIGVRPGRVRWVHRGAVGVVRCRLTDIGRVRSRSMGSFGCALGVIGYVRGDWVHWGAPWGSLGSFVVAGFLGERLGGSPVRSGSLGSFGCTLGVFGFALPGVRRVRSGSLCSPCVRGRWIHWEHDKSQDAPK